MKPPAMNMPLLRVHPAGSDAPDISSEAFDTILQVMKSRRGFNLDIYKDKCIKRRIAIRITKTNCASATEYGELLLQDTAEPDRLLRVLTVHVSQFFRNPSTFQKLEEVVFPYLFSHCDRENRAELKLWSVGCAGGEEPYSAALLLKESFADRLTRRDISILATDIDPEVLETARKGIYREERLAEVTREIRDRWFTPRDGKFQLAPEIMNMVTFGRGDLFDVGSFPESDLILCRNVLIYLERIHQERILNGFADALRTGGILVLGKAETLVGESRQRFQTICPVERIYRVV
jgi:chemotaxis protein methyltransferase CheR